MDTDVSGAYVVAVADAVGRGVVGLEEGDGFGVPEHEVGVVGVEGGHVGVDLGDLDLGEAVHAPERGPFLGDPAVDRPGVGLRVQGEDVDGAEAVDVLRVERVTGVVGVMGVVGVTGGGVRLRHRFPSREAQGGASR